VSIAVFRAMVLGLLRDRGALLMSFVLPAVFFFIMAETFTASSSENLRLRVLVLDEVGDHVSARLLTALDASDALTVTRSVATGRAALRDRVRSGDADIGLVIRSDAPPLDESTAAGPPPLLIVADPARGAAAPVLTGQLRQAYLTALPEVALGNTITELEQQFLTLTPEQRAAVDAGLERMRADAVAGAPAPAGFDDLVAREDVAGGEAANLVAYSAGAVAFMFLLFSSVHGAVSLLEEQETGIIDRILAGPGGIGVLVNGKFLYIVVQGLVQVSVIFAVAWLYYRVDLPGRAGAWLVITLAASVSAAGLAMLLATACRTRRQAQTVANTVILVLSALGGSMVPRFFMPEALRDLGWLTPNTWALEAYSGVLWRGEPLSGVATPIALLLLSGLAGWLLAGLLAHRRAYGPRD
jgi:ABC-2 type transport system permease protein